MGNIPTGLKFCCLITPYVLFGEAGGEANRESRCGVQRFQCLLPLVNKPIIDYTFECLANAGIEEIILYSGAHSDQLERYIKYVYTRTFFLGSILIFGC